MSQGSLLGIEAVVLGDNSDLIQAVAALHVRNGDRIADLTFGKGVFWRKCPHLNITGSDIVTVPERNYDMRATPYVADEFDIAVIDPPYVHNPGNHVTDARYQNAETTKGLYHDDIRKLYVQAMLEAKRIAKRQVWVKCKDQVESGIQRWSHCELLSDALAMGLFARDLFILLPTSQTSRARWTSQHHARKPHSYLWVFEKPGDPSPAALARAKVWSALAQ